jgi:hypothetical protein
MKQENEPYSGTSVPTTMVLKKTIVQKREGRNAREQTRTARGDETGEAMTTKKYLQAIVGQLGLIDLGEAQYYYWEKERKHMTTMQELQEIVGQLGLIDLGEAQQYWGNGKMDKDVNDNKRKQLLDAKANIESHRNAA